MNNAYPDVQKQIQGNTRNMDKELILEDRNFNLKELLHI